MSGYTPVFRSVFEGSLCGQYPDTAAWLFMLALADKNGVVDMHAEYISRITGMPVSDLMPCMERFCTPDPASRTPGNEGRRLERIDPARPWGWRIINFGLYRERARKQAWDAKRTASGQDAERKRRVRTKAVPTCPDVSRQSPLSNTNTNTNDKNSVRATASPSTIDQALFAEARSVFGKSIGGTINKAIKDHGKAWVLGIIEQCRGRDPEAARAYLHAALRPKERGFVA